MSPPYAEVLVTLPVFGRFHYLIPEALQGGLQPGHRVLVPFGPRRVTGFVRALTATRPEGLPAEKLRPIESQLDPEPLVPPELLRLVEFAASYYLAPAGEVLRVALPPGLTAASILRWVITEAGARRLAEAPELFSAPALRLLQQAAGSGGARHHLSPEAMELQKAGWIQARAQLKTRSQAQVELLERAVDPRQAWPQIRRARTRLRLFELLENGPLSRPALEAKMGKQAFMAARGRMLKDGLIRQRFVPQRGLSPTELTATPPEALPTLSQEQAAALVPIHAAIAATTEPPEDGAPPPQAGGTPEVTQDALQDPAPQTPPPPASIPSRDKPRASQAGGATEVTQGALRIPEGQAAPPSPGEPRPPQAGGAPEVTQDALRPATAAAPPRAFLLNGVTGSGKTEVYLRAIAQALEAGQGALVLVPEIALTPQLAARFVARFGPLVVVLHSAIPEKERLRRWFALRDGEAKIVLGARSALWAPVQRLGVVIVDEEHDASFKQNNEVRYSGRDLALTRAKQAGAVAILGSATPSLESLQLVERGRLAELRMRHRVMDRPLPKVEIVDLSLRKRRHKQAQALISIPLCDALAQTLAAGQQAILFLNRRGFNTVVFCEDCGDARRCENCEVSLTYHKSQDKLRCHYCDYQCSIYRACPSCGSHAVTPFGAGTEQVEAAVQELLPDARVLRLDRDVSAKAGALEATLAAFRAREADVLVGTQMVAKGHDFPGVTLVGVLLADASLAFPDFRAAERTFQLLTQVAGRAGRAEAPGRVIIQTFQPDHYAITHAVRHDAAGFAEIELQQRRQAAYPPYRRMGLIRIEDPKAEAVQKTADRLNTLARAWAASEPLRCLGPAPAPIERLRGRWRYLFMLFSPSPARLVHVMGRLRAAAEAERLPAHLVFDVDPLDLL